MKMFMAGTWDGGDWELIVLIVFLLITLSPYDESNIELNVLISPFSNADMIAECEFKACLIIDSRFDGEPAPRLLLSIFSNCLIFYSNFIYNITN